MHLQLTLYHCGMTEPFVKCTMCGASFPQYMAACPQCGVYREARTTEQVVSERGEARKMSSMAIAGFVLSLTIWWMFVVGPIVSLAVSTVALLRIRNPLNNLGGRGFAIAGIVISILWIAAFVFLFFIAPALWGTTSTDADGTVHWSFGEPR